MRPYFPIIMLAYVLAPCLAASEILVGSASVEICVSQLIILLYLCSRQGNNDDPFEDECSFSCTGSWNKL